MGDSSEAEDAVATLECSFDDVDVVDGGGDIKAAIKALKTKFLGEIYY